MSQTQSNFTTRFLTTLLEYGNELEMHKEFCYISCNFLTGNQHVYIASNDALALHTHFNQLEKIEQWEYVVTDCLANAVTLKFDENFDSEGVFMSMNHDECRSFIREVISNYIGDNANDTDWLEMVKLIK